MARGVSPEIKAAALADLAAGEQPAVVADRYRLKQATVRSWKLRSDATIDATPVATRNATVMRKPAIEAQQQTLAELVMENLRAKLIATQRIAEHATNPIWLDKQTAADLAGLFECLDRSALNIVDRLATAQRPALPGTAAGDEDVA